MGCKIFIFALIHWLFCLNYILCQSKDMGDVTMNSSYQVVNDIEPKIIGGRTVSLKQYPFNVQFYNLGGLCGGSILTKKTVLTAAHCFSHNKNLTYMMVISRPRIAFDRSASTHGVWDFKIHDNYNRKHLFSSDIAVIIVHTDFVFGPLVQKATIATTDSWMKVNQVFTATGWGETRSGSTDNKNSLQAVQLRYVPLKRCMVLNGVKLGADMFCLYAKGRDTCKGDSGGGILWKGILVGITSHGRGCGGAPGMYTNVYYFRSWIIKTVATLSKQYCSIHCS